MDDLDAQLLDRIQTELPLVARPYAALAEAIGSDEATVLERVAALREQGSIRQISAIFDSRRLGYRGMLVAARTPVERQDAAAEVFSSHPGVSHNYLREHELNLWFTLTVSPRSQLGLDAPSSCSASSRRWRSSARCPRCASSRSASTSTSRATATRPPSSQGDARAQAPPPEALTDRDIDAIRALQLDLPPARAVRRARRAGGFDGRQLLERGHCVPRDRADAPLRRRARAPQRGLRAERHGRVDVPEERIDECGLAMAAFRGVSHCYQRPTYPDWPYNLFSMTHGRTKDECEAVLAAVAERDRARRLLGAVLHEGVQEDARLVLHA